ncbi:class III lanthipeptide [Kribbella sp. DT2]
MNAILNLQRLDADKGHVGQEPSISITSCDSNSCN